MSARGGFGSIGCARYPSSMFWTRTGIEMAGWLAGWLAACRFCHCHLPGRCTVSQIFTNPKTTTDKTKKKNMAQTLATFPPRTTFLRGLAGTGVFLTTLFKSFFFFFILGVFPRFQQFFLPFQVRTEIIWWVFEVGNVSHIGGKSWRIRSIVRGGKDPTCAYPGRPHSYSVSYGPCAPVVRRSFPLVRNAPLFTPPHTPTRMYIRVHVHRTGSFPLIFYLNAPIGSAESLSDSCMLISVFCFLINVCLGVTFWWRFLFY